MFGAHFFTSWIDVASEWQNKNLDQWLKIPSQIDFWGQQQNQYFLLCQCAIKQLNRKMKELLGNNPDNISRLELSATLEAE
jgi:hypothetical protein